MLHHSGISCRGNVESRSLRCHALPTGRANARPMTGSGGGHPVRRALSVNYWRFGLLNRPVEPGDDIELLFDGCAGWVERQQTHQSRQWHQHRREVTAKR